MKLLLRLIMLTTAISGFISFNVFAMNEKLNVNEPVMAVPSTEIKHADKSSNYGWVWLSDNLCVRFKQNANSDKTRIQDMYNMGLIDHWYENNQIKTRDTYTGKWIQAENGIWSFLFDDYTIPVGVAKIDGVLYAFNGYGELQDGYEYYTGCKTAADGLVTEIGRAHV